eukprot:7390791-Prymnesium_polylepis.2
MLKRASHLEGIVEQVGAEGRAVELPHDVGPDRLGARAQLPKDVHARDHVACGCEHRDSNIHRPQMDAG